jgi:hypothetical protein
MPSAHSAGLQLPPAAAAGAHGGAAARPPQTHDTCTPLPPHTQIHTQHTHNTRTHTHTTHAPVTILMPCESGPLTVEGGRASSSSSVSPQRMRDRAMAAAAAGPRRAARCWCCCCCGCCWHVRVSGRGCGGVLLLRARACAATAGGVDARAVETPLAAAGQHTAAAASAAHLPTHTRHTAATRAGTPGGGVA